MTNISETQHSVCVATNVDNGKDDRVRVGDSGVIVDHGLHRKLKQRHLQMIALGGVVGCVVDLCSSQPSQEHPLKLAQCKYLVRNRGCDCIFRAGILTKPRFIELVN